MSTTEALAQQQEGAAQHVTLLQILKLDTNPGVHEDGSPKGYVVFGQAPDALGYLPRPKLTINPEAWREYGCPTTLTVIIKPGDHTND